MTADSAGAAATVNVVVTCTNRKSRSAPSHLRLADVPGRDGMTRAGEWIARLSGEDNEPGLPARDLYCGEHWAIARALPQLGDCGETVRLWTCSAGYGLIPADAIVHPYAATFTAGHADSVQGDPAEWWQSLSTWDGPAHGQPRTIRALAEQDPKAVFIVILSPPYLKACRHDVAGAVTAAADPDRFMLISAGSRKAAGDLAALLLPADARLQSHLGGTRQTLNIRAGHALLKAGIRSRAEASAYLSGLLAKQPPIMRYDRKKLDDGEVMSLIAASLARSPGVSANRLLREFRDSGYACEQKRFGDLVRRFKEGIA
jgi:hypothetical protein